MRAYSCGCHDESAAQRPNSSAHHRATALTKDDEFRRQPQDHRTQVLLVVRQNSTLLTFGLQFLLERSNTPHEIRFTQALQRIVRRPRRSFLRTSTTPLLSPASLAVGNRHPGKGFGRLAVERVSARIPADHLEAQARETGLRLARHLLERFSRDLLAGRAERGDSSAHAADRAIRTFARASLKVSKVILTFVPNHLAHAAFSEPACFQCGVQRPCLSASPSSSISLRSCLSSLISRLGSRAPARSPMRSCASAAR